MTATMTNVESLRGVTAATAMIDFGMTQQEFRERYFEKKYLLLRNALKCPKFSWQDVDALLFQIDPVPPHCKLFANDEIPTEQFVDERLEHGSPRRRINKAKFYDYLRGGATMVLNRVETASLAALRLCKHVGRFAGHPTIGNAYLSFGGKGTFGKHWDTHDVFVLQLLGKKRWKIFKPTWPLPLSHQRSGGQEESCPDVAEFECELHPGDVLYLPRGWWHQAIPFEGGSFHLSVGAYAATAMEFVQWVAQRRLSLIESARVGLTDATQPIDVDDILARLATALRDPQELTAFHRWLAEREPVNSELDLESSTETTSGELPDDTTIHLSSCYPIVFNGPHLTINGMELRLESLRRVLVLTLNKESPLTLRSLYASVPAVPRTAVRAALLDLAQHDVLTVRRPL